MPNSFFSKFPTISYNDTFAKNILARVNFNDVSRKNIIQYYSYTMSQYERVDNLAFDYYDDSDFAWLVMLANQVVDPYYDLNISDDDFNSLISTKYGSILDAQTKVYAFKTNWESDDRILDQAAYDALPSITKKYWNPIISYNSLTQTYERKKQDILISTNRTVTIPFSSASGSFEVGETISQPYSPSLTSKAEITNIDTTNNIITAKHYIGQFLSGTITGNRSGVTATVPNIVDQLVSNGGNIIQRNISQDEDVYWVPISVYDYEYKLNDDKRNISLIEKQRSGDIANQVKKLLNP